MRQFNHKVCIKLQYFQTFDKKKSVQRRKTWSQARYCCEGEVLGLREEVSDWKSEGLGFFCVYTEKQKKKGAEKLRRSGLRAQQPFDWLRLMDNLLTPTLLVKSCFLFLNLAFIMFSIFTPKGFRFPAGCCLPRPLSPLRYYHVLDLSGLSDTSW